MSTLEKMQIEQEFYERAKLLIRELKESAKNSKVAWLKRKQEMEADALQRQIDKITQRNKRVTPILSCYKQASVV